LYDDPSEANTARGDSGGPGFLFIEGESFIASITSGGSVFDSSLGDVAFNTRVDAFADWIDVTLLETVATDPNESDPSESDPSESDPSDPDTDSPTDDVTDDGDNNSDGDVITACEDYLSKPFPFLSFLIDLLTSLLQSLSEATETSTVTEVAQTPEATETAVDNSDSVTETVAETASNSATQKTRRARPQRRGRSVGR
ncbi:MAG: hypothetical protein WBD31_01940, partial [Rubripirellula sp.]